MKRIGTMLSPRFLFAKDLILEQAVVKPLNFVYYVHHYSMSAVSGTGYIKHPSLHVAAGALRATPASLYHTVVHLDLRSVVTRYGPPLMALQHLAYIKPIFLK